MKNVPYRKIIGKNRLVENPITKNNPYLHNFPSTRDEKKQLKGVKNNKKGIRLVVTNLGKGKFSKYKVVTQLFRKPNIKGKRTVQHYIPV